MWYAATVTAPPDGLVVSVADVKTRLRVDTADEDDLIADVIEEVTQEAESYCNLYLRQRALDLSCDKWADLGRLPVGPLPTDAIQSLAYVDTDGADQTVPSDSYELLLIGIHGLEASLVPVEGEAWPAIKTGSKIKISLNAGYENLPLDMRLALYERIADRYEKRETRPSGEFSSWDAMLINYRRGI